MLYLKRHKIFYNQFFNKVNINYSILIFYSSNSVLNLFLILSLNYFFDSVLNISIDYFKSLIYSAVITIHYSNNTFFL